MILITIALTDIVENLLLLLISAVYIEGIESRNCTNHQQIKAADFSKTEQTESDSRTRNGLLPLASETEDELTSSSCERRIKEQQELQQ